MNPYPNATANAYKTLEVTSSHRLKVVVMIYDAGIAALKQALASHNRNDLIKRNQYVSRAQFIVQELNNSLDMQRGMEISSNLRKLYFFLIRHLSQVLTDNDREKIEQSLAILLKLREAWQEISQKTLKDENVQKASDVYHTEKKLDAINV